MIYCWYDQGCRLFSGFCSARAIVPSPENAWMIYTVFLKVYYRLQEGVKEDIDYNTNLLSKELYWLLSVRRFEGLLVHNIIQSIAMKWGLIKGHTQRWLLVTRIMELCLGTYYSCKTRKKALLRWANAF